MVVASAAMALLVAGQVARFLSRMISWALLVLIVVALAYAAYELSRGWSAAEADDHIADTRDSVVAEDIDQSALASEDESADPSTQPTHDTELSDAEFEAELDRLADEESLVIDPE